MEANKRFNVIASDSTWFVCDFRLPLFRDFNSNCIQAHSIQPIQLHLAPNGSPNRALFQVASSELAQRGKLTMWFIFFLWIFEVHIFLSLENLVRRARAASQASCQTSHHCAGSNCELRAKFERRVLSQGPEMFLQWRLRRNRSLNASNASFERFSLLNVSSEQF